MFAIIKRHRPSINQKQRQPVIVAEACTAQEAWVLSEADREAEGRATEGAVPYTYHCIEFQAVK